MTKLIEGNLCSFDLLNHILDIYQIDTVIHFAAQSHVDISIRNSLKFTKVNVLGKLDVFFIEYLKAFTTIFCLKIANDGKKFWGKN